MPEKTFTKNNRTYSYTEETSDEDSDGDYLHAEEDPNDSDNYEDLDKGPSVQEKYKGKNVKHQENQTQPYQRKTKEQREIDSPRFAHTYTTEELEGTSESATQIDENPYHPLARIKTPSLISPLPEEETDYQTTFREQSNTFDELARRLDQLVFDTGSDNSTSELDVKMSNHPVQPTDPEFIEGPVPLVANTVKKQKLPDPEPFYGKREKLSTWLVQLNIKLTGNDENFEDENSKLLYACSLLRGPAIEWAEPYINNQNKSTAQPRFTDIEDFKNKIKAALGDPDPAGTAEDEIRNLKQGRDECSAYFTKFSQHVHRLSWDDAAKIAQFRYGLDSRISDKLIGRDNVPTEFPEYAQLCIRLDNEIRAHQRRRGTHPQRSFTHYHHTNQRPNIPNWVTQGTRPGFQRPQHNYKKQTYVREEDRRTSNPSYHGPAKMEIDAIKKDNACFKCGRKGHYARNCKNGTPQRGQQQQRNFKQPQRNGPPQQIKTAQRSSSEETEPSEINIKQKELDWIRENPLNSQCYHIKFIRSSEGALYQKFLNPDRYEKTRKIRNIAQTHQRNTNYIKATTITQTRHTHPERKTQEEREKKCTNNWCKKLGSRRHFGISVMTFGNKCDRACQPFNCTKCGRTREQEEDSDGMIPVKSLSEQECSTCRHSELLEVDEEQRIQATLATGRIPKGTRRFIDEIEEKLETITNPRTIARIKAAIQQLRANEDEERELDDMVPVTKFTITGTITMEAQECPVCYEPGKQQEYISADGRITACEECAKIWTETTGYTTWNKIQPKN
jgi:Retrotransposon gag protein/Zinc knuckle